MTLFNSLNVFGLLTAILFVGFWTKFYVHIAQFVSSAMDIIAMDLEDKNKAE